MRSPSPDQPSSSPISGFASKAKGWAHLSETGAAQRVPADLLRRPQSLPAADIEPVLRAGQTDIQQAAVFLHLAVPPRSLFRDVMCGDMIAGRLPQWQLVIAPQHRHLLVGDRHRIGQKDDRRFEALGAVHGQDADLVARAGREVALDLGVGGRQPAQKPLQRRHMLALIGERQTEELLDRVFGLGAEAMQQRAASALGAEDFAIKLIGRDEIGAGEPGRKPIGGTAQLRARFGARRRRFHRVSLSRGIGRGRTAAPRRCRRAGFSAPWRGSNHPRAAAEIGRAPPDPAPPTARSAPGGRRRRPGRPRCFSARSNSPTNSLRRRTSTMMSPARSGRSRAASRSPVASHCSIVAAMARASRA